MIKKILFSLTALVFSFSLSAQEPPKQKSPEEMAYEESNRLEKLLNLQPHQTFFVDSLLQHDMRAMKEETERLQRTGVQEVTVFQTIQKKWVEQIEKGYRKIFTDEQWNEYLKSQGKFKKDKKDKKDKRGGKNKN